MWGRVVTLLHIVFKRVCHNLIAKDNIRAAHGEIKQNLYKN